MNLQYLFYYSLLKYRSHSTVQTTGTTFCDNKVDIDIVISKTDIMFQISNSLNEIIVTMCTYVGKWGNPGFETVEVYICTGGNITD